MHGRPRAPKGSAPDEEKIKQQTQKAMLFGKLLREVNSQLCTQHSCETSTQPIHTSQAPYLSIHPHSKQVLERRSSKRMDEESMALCAKLLELNPEVYTGWNYRREFLEPILREGGAPALHWIEVELQLTFKALQRNPKSYHTWHHRKWLVAKRMCSIDKELELVRRSYMYACTCTLALSR